MKILHLIPYFIRADKTGGPAQQLNRLARAEQMLGHQVTVATTTGNLDEEVDLTFDGDVLETLENDLPTTYLRRKNGLFPPTYYYAPALPGWLKAHLDAFDVVVIHGTWTYFSLVGARLCRKARKPYLIFVHGSLDPWAMNHHRLKKVPYWHLQEKHHFRNASGVVVLSQEEAAQVRAMGIDKPTFLARNGLMLPVPRVCDPASLLANHWPELNGHPYVCSISRLHPKKGLDILLDAWAELHSRYPEWRLVIAGPDEGGYLAKLQSQAQQLGLHKSVLFPGLVTGDIKAALLQNASLFVLPSHSEGVPGAVVEAMAYGLPVLITPGCHLPEVAEAQAGLIVEPQTEAVASGLQRLMSGDTLRRAMGYNASHLVKVEFDEKSIAGGLVEFCQPILEQQHHVT